MNLAQTLQARFQVLPPQLQTEALDFIGYLEQKYGLNSPSTSNIQTQAFIERVAHSLGNDFPDDINDLDLADESKKDSLE